MVSRVLLCGVFYVLLRMVIIVVMRLLEYFIVIGYVKFNFGLSIDKLVVLLSFMRKIGSILWI